MSMVSKFGRRNTTNLFHTTLIAENNLQALIMKIKEHSEKMGQRLNIRKTRLITGTTTSLRIDSEDTENSFCILGSPITYQAICHRLAHEKAAMKIWKKYTDAVTYKDQHHAGKSWTLNKHKGKKTEVFECWRRLTRKHQ